MQPIGGVDLLTHCQHVDALVNSFCRARDLISVNIVLSTGATLETRMHAQSYAGK
jgi:hypothetical protein